MLNRIDKFLNRITMYRLVLYYLIGLLIWAFILAVFHALPFKPFDLLYSALILVAVCWVANQIFATAFNVPANVESNIITALILSLLITPAITSGSTYFTTLGFLIWAGSIAMASKYILAWRGKHLFNPAAIAVVITAFTIHQSASWWVGTFWMLPAVIVGGLLLLRKLQRFDLFFSFLIPAVAIIIFLSPSRAMPLQLIQRIFVDTPILFFGFVMLTEPLTAPARQLPRLIYGLLTGLIFSPNLHLGPIYSTPEISLVVANIFTFLVSPHDKHLLVLKSREEISTNIYEFMFTSKQRFAFQPGQYMEFTVPAANSDNRGNRRYFTIASSPTEHHIHLGIKFYDQPSTFKQKLLALRPSEHILAAQLAGDFILPKNPRKKLVFIAGGIGITPFRSMLKYLVDRGEKRNIVLFYSNASDSEIAYPDVLNEAWEKLHLKVVLTLTNPKGIPADWPGFRGYFTPQIIKSEMPDFLERMYYLSGPRSMVVGFEKSLKQLGVPRSHIKTDFFPGLV